MMEDTPPHATWGPPDPNLRAGTKVGGRAPMTTRSSRGPTIQALEGLMVECCLITMVLDSVRDPTLVMVP